MKMVEVKGVDKKRVEYNGWEECGETEQREVWVSSTRAPFKTSAKPIQTGIRD